MNFNDAGLIRERLNSHLLSSQGIRDPKLIVCQLTCVQAQDKRGARWSIGLRVPDSKELDVVQSINGRAILRTWLLRGTLHYVACDDLLWVLGLISPRVIHTNARRYKQLDLDEKVFDKSQAVVQRILQMNGEVSRGEIKNAFLAAGIPAQGQQMPYLLQRAALDGLIYISGMRGRNTLFRLVSALGLPKNDLDREAALVRLARRFFRGHGPTTAHDFAWWSGLTMNDAIEGMAGCEGLTEINLHDEKYWHIEESAPEKIEKKAFLLPPFDEYVLGYKNREPILDPGYAKRVNAGGGMLKPTLLVEGRVAGTWKLGQNSQELSVNIQPFAKIKLSAQEWILTAVQRLGDFYQKPASVSFLNPV